MRLHARFFWDSYVTIMIILVLRKFYIFKNSVLLIWVPLVFCPSVRFVVSALDPIEMAVKAQVHICIFL